MHLQMHRTYAVKYGRASRPSSHVCVSSARSFALCIRMRESITSALWRAESGVDRASPPRCSDRQSTDLHDARSEKESLAETAVEIVATVTRYAVDGELRPSETTCTRCVRNRDDRWNFTAAASRIRLQLSENA